MNPATIRYSTVTSNAGLSTGDDGVTRCRWGASAPDYAAYHDEEWGMPVSNDHRLFEKICLEGFQSGLSWLTILRKREAFREVFLGFDFERVARFNARSVDRLLRDARIVRHRGKIESTIHNARCACALADEHGSLAAFFWQYEPPPTERPQRIDRAALMKLSKTPTSTQLSKDLKRQGFRFVGPTTVYAFMQAMGMVNDHLEGCEARPRVDRARRRFTRPTMAR